MGIFLNLRWYGQRIWRQPAQASGVSRGPELSVVQVQQVSETITIVGANSEQMVGLYHFASKTGRISFRCQYFVVCSSWGS